MWETAHHAESLLTGAAAPRGRTDMRKGRMPKHPPFPVEASRRQRQRVVMRKPTKAMPKPMRMFHEPRSAMGKRPWLT